MALTSQEQYNLNALTSILFNAASGGYLQIIETLFVDSNKDYSLLTKVLGSTEAFTSQFSQLNTISDQADQLLSHLGLSVGSRLVG